MSDEKMIQKKPRKCQRALIVAESIIAFLIILLVWQLFAYTSTQPRTPQNKLNLLARKVLSTSTQEYINDMPAGEVAQNVVFLSISNGFDRALVFHATGRTLTAAWSTVTNDVEQFSAETGYDLKWVKADIVCASAPVSKTQIEELLARSVPGCFRYGLAFDKGFSAAILEEDLNAALIYEYSTDEINTNRMADYFEFYNMPDQLMNNSDYTAFQCISWFCDENNEVYRLSNNQADYGRRILSAVDDEVATEMIMNAANYLTSSIKDDGSFVYELFAPTNLESDTYNIVRHAGAIWSILQAYRINHNPDTYSRVISAVDHMISAVIFDEVGRGYLYDAEEEEICLGGNAIAVLALTEFQNVFQDDRYEKICVSLGEGILSLFDSDTGQFHHILYKDMTPGDEFRTVFYDGEATFALCRLYALTRDTKWLSAAQRSVEHFIADDYTQYADHWVAYSMNEITKYFPTNREYYRFGLRNISENIDVFANDSYAVPTYLEMLMATFELYARMKSNGISTDEFNVSSFLQAISTRTRCLANSYFYPEFAMYMNSPQRVLNTFMTRTDNFRVRIDDVQHAIGGAYLYVKNYDDLVQLGLPAVEE